MLAATASVNKKAPACEEVAEPGSPRRSPRTWDQVPLWGFAGILSRWAKTWKASRGCLVIVCVKLKLVIWFQIEAKLKLRYKSSNLTYRELRDAPLSKKCSFFEHCSKGLWPPPPFIWTFVLFCRGCFLNAFLSIWYNVPILPPNFTINASKVPFHANFMLLNDLQNTRQFPT